MSKGTTYYVIYCISKDDFRVVLNDDKTVALWSDFETAEQFKKQFQEKHPEVHYHIRTLNWESKFEEEYKG